MIFRRTRSIHFVGIGGVGMSGIAEVLLTLGYKITGSDIKESARIRNLSRKGADIELEHRPENVHGADVVVKTSAVGEDNPEVVEAHRLDIPVIPRAEMLAELMRLKQGIAVAGTHGKTTTTAMVSRILQSAGYDPTVVVGGRMHNMGIGARLGTDDLIVVEADESDGSFLHLNPVMSIVTNIDNDHMDYYESMAEVEETFLEFMNSVPFYGFTAACGDDERIESLASRLQKPYQTYGFGSHNKLRASDRTVTDRGTKFTVTIEDRPLGDIDLQVPGEYNVLNALGAAAVGFEQGIGFDQVKRGLEKFEGVARRFDFKGESRGLKVYDDYAHHPTEIEKTLQAAREQFDGELIVIFQPHRYSRTREHASEFGEALDVADALCVTDVYAAGEDPIEGVDLEFLEANIAPRRNGHVTDFRAGRNELLEWVRDRYESGREQVLFTVGAGDVVDLADPILERANKWGGGHMRILENEPMAPHTTFKIGGRAQHLYEPEDEADIDELLERLNGKMDRAFFMGRGSNLLIKDGLVKTPFVRLAGQFESMTFENDRVRAGSAVPMPKLSMKSAREGYYGLEWASGVPGTVGGAVMMNAGAFDHNTQERLESVRVMDREGTITTLNRGEIDFDYRHCSLRNDYLVLAATFRLEPAESETVRENTRELIKERREQQPVGYNSAGCIFKNGDDYYAAELIDEAGLKGASEGNAYVSEQHANYMINRGGARFDDVLRLIDRVRRRISSDYDKDLELELCIVDE